MASSTAAVAFTGSEDSVVAVFGAAMSGNYCLALSTTVIDGTPLVFLPYADTGSRSSTGCTVITPARFTGVVELIATDSP